MKDVDLAQFQFDYDLTWAAFFMNPNGAIYGRYGTRSKAGAMAHNSIASLKNAMRRALEVHHNYPAKQASIAAKRGGQPRWKTALEIPALRKQFAQHLMEPTGRKNCIHCHNIYDGWHQTAYDEGRFDKASLWVYPLPDNIGMVIDVDSGVVIEKVTEGSFAAEAGIQPGDVINTMNGQTIVSIADMQWVLHHLPKVSDLQIEVRRNGKPLMETLSLDGDWKKSDISWRASMWGLPPRLGIGARQLTVAEKQERGLGPNALALRILWRPRGDVWEAGLRKGDIIVAADGKTEAMNHPRFNVWVKLNYRPGDQLPLKVIRGDQSVSLTILLK